MPFDNRELKNSHSIDVAYDDLTNLRLIIYLFRNIYTIVSIRIQKEQFFVLCVLLQKYYVATQSF